MSDEMWPNGQCGACGNGLNDEGGCVDPDCTECVNQFDQNEVLAAVLAIFPDAELAADDDGELVVNTRCMWTGNEGEQIMGNFTPRG